MPVPPQPQAPENTGDFWNNFGALTDKDPANAWRYLNQAQQTPDIFRNKMLVME
jgi:Tfp pilus assembly protein PilF